MGFIKDFKEGWSRGLQKGTNIGTIMRIDIEQKWSIWWQNMKQKLKRGDKNKKI